jgi:hypothetical protein
MLQRGEHAGSIYHCAGRGRELRPGSALQPLRVAAPVIMPVIGRTLVS